jgi:two-component system response regulator NreC
LKDSAFTDLVRAIESVIQGKSFFSPKISRILAEDYVRALKQKGSVDTYELLTGREREILQLLAEGKSNKEVATKVNISLSTVETHRGHILQKLNLHSAAELVLYAVRKASFLKRVRHLGALFAIMAEGRYKVRPFTSARVVKSQPKNTLQLG